MAELYPHLAATRRALALPPTQAHQAYPERPPTESGFCSMAAIWHLDALGVSRRVALLLSEREATCLIAVISRARLVDSLLFGKGVGNGN